MELSPPVQPQKFGKRIVLGFAVTGTILAAISGMMFSSITQLLRSSDWVAHSYRVLDTLDLTQAFFSDAEASERGYVATCKPSLITPFRHDLPQIYAQLASLQNLTNDNPAHRERMAFLTRTMTAELERMSATISVAAKGNQLEAEAEIADKANIDATQQVFSTLGAMESEERTILAGRLHDVKIFAWATLTSCAVGVMAIFGILGFVFWLIRRESRRREIIETSLHKNKGELESSLQELQRYNASAQAVSVLGELLQTCRTTDEALAIAARHLGDLLPEDAGTVALFTDSRDGIKVASSFGDRTILGDALYSPQFQADDCWALRRGRIHAAGPNGFEPRCGHVEGPALSFLCIPMVAQGETLGVLTVARNRAFAEFERQTVQTISEQLSLALANLKLQEKLRSQSLRDPLTGLFNRRYMDEALSQQVARATRGGTPLAIAMLDIDHFKRFNDTHGHEGGDVLLAAFGRLLAEHARGEDIVCRYGGEEFAVILPGADAAAAARRLDEIRMAVRALRVHNKGQSLGPVSMSAGIGVFPHNGDTAAIVMAAADEALYEAKRSGRDRVMCANQNAGVARQAVPR